MKTIQFTFGDKISETLEIEDIQLEKIKVVRDMVESLLGTKCKILVDGVLQDD